MIYLQINNNEYQEHLSFLRHETKWSPTVHNEQAVKTRKMTPTNAFKHFFDAIKFYVASKADFNHHDIIEQEV